MTFLDTPNGQIIAGAHRYLSAARLLLNSDEFDRRTNLLKIPALHLTAHGIELLLKFPLLEAGRSVENVRRQFGHDLNQLWDEPSNGSLRELVTMSATRAWSTAEQSGKWSDNFSRRPEIEIVAQLRLLAPLHSKETDFALRYIAPANTPAPRPMFLADAFGDAAERLIKNPRLLDHYGAQSG